MGMSNVWKFLSVVSGLLLLLTYLLIQSRSPDLALRARMQEALQTLQLHDTELTRDVLLARAGLLPHYDSLPRTGQSLSRALGTLRAESATISGQAAQEMGQHVEALAAALHQKLTLVEYFTSDNALLRDSLTYLTYAGQTLGTRVEEEPAVAADIAALSHVLLRFIHRPELSVGKELGAALHRLSHTPLFPQDFHTLVAHGRLIVEVLPQVDTLLRQIIAAPTAPHAAAFQGAVLRYANRVKARAELFRVLLYLVAVMLLGYLLYQFARMPGTCAVPMRTYSGRWASVSRLSAPCAPAKNASVPSRNRRMTPSFPLIARDTSSPGMPGRRRSSATPRRRSWARPSRA
jgi:DAHL domain